MRFRFHITVAVGLSLLAAQFASAEERYILDIEAGPAWQLRNDFAVPGDTGTRVRLDDEGPLFSGRTTLVWHASKRWSLRVLAAPLSTESDFVPTSEVLFQGETFAAGQPIRVDYRFDSYRVGGFYRFASSGRWALRAGATLKVRDARIALSSSETFAEKTDTGVVPLLYGGARFRASDRIALDLDVDAAAASQGRAVDAALRVEAQLSDATSVYLGGRVLEGGADNDEVFSFATFAYVFAGAQFRW